MPDTPNRGIPYVPEGTLDPAAGLNLALDVIDALLQTAVISMSETTPPATGANGDLYIVAEGATGAWAGHDNDLARFVDEGNFWQFFTAGSQVVLVLNLEDGGLYKWSVDSPTGWVLLVGATPDLFAPVIDEAGASVTALSGVYGNYTRFTHASPTYHFPDYGTDWVIGAEYHGRYQGAGTLEITSDTGFTINPPFGGSLVIPAGGTFTVKVVSATQADLFGVTESSS